MAEHDPYAEVNVAIATALVREGWMFQSQLAVGEPGERLRVWLVPMAQAGSVTPIVVSLVGARNLFSASVTFRPLAPIGELRDAVSAMLVDVLPFVRSAIVNDDLILRAEFPLDLGTPIPVSAVTVVAAVQTVAAAAAHVLDRLAERVELGAPERVHVPRWGGLTASEGRTLES